MVVKLCNAFSLNMLKRGNAQVSIKQVSLEEVKRLIEREGFVSFIGHDDTARLLSNLLELHVPANRQSLLLEDGEVLLVAQYHGPRLPEGATTLPPGANINWFLITISYT